MSEVIHIPKANEQHTNYPCWLETETSAGVVVRPHIRCKCGDYLNCIAHHIHPDGTVTASFYHKEGDPHGGCGWHVYLKLEDWPGLEFLPHQDRPI
jgi:hypothetical protein